MQTLPACMRRCVLVHQYAKSVGKGMRAKRVHTQEVLCEKEQPASDMLPDSENDRTPPLPYCVTKSSTLVPCELASLRASLRVFACAYMCARLHA